MNELPCQPLNAPEVVAEVRAVFDRYEAALTGNDVATLIELFWDAPETVRYGVGEIAAFRHARTTGPFRREIMNTVITTFGRDFAVASTEYRREDHARPGRESKTFVRTTAGWRVVAAHVSLLGETV